jgi:hypothetical protein
MCIYQSAQDLLLRKKFEKVFLFDNAKGDKRLLALRRDLIGTIF